MADTSFENMDWGPAVEDFILDKRGQCAPKTADFYRCQITLIMRWAIDNGVTLDGFNARNMRKYLDYRATAGVSEQTRHHDVIAAKGFLKFCHAEKYIASNPLYDFKAPKAAKPYVKSPSEDEVKRILQAIDDRRTPKTNPNSRFSSANARRFLAKRDRAIVAGLVETAARIGEILNLRLDDLDRDRKQVVFTETKGNEPRTIPVSDTWLDIVDSWLRLRPKSATCDLVFVTVYGEPLSVRPFSRQFQRYCEYAEVEDVTLHSLRHYALTTLAKNDLWAASQIAGHKDLRVTRGYLHNDPEHVRKAHTDAAPLSRLLVNNRSEKQKRRKMLV